MNRCKFNDFLAIVVFSLLFIGVVVSKSVSALTYQKGIDVSFTFNPTIRVTLSSDLVISDLAPGTADDSNVITVNVVTNTMYGYTLNATVGNSTTYDTRDLIHDDSLVTDKFTSTAYSATPTIANKTNLADDTWAYSYSVDNGTSWANYNGLPKYDDTTNIATLKSSNGPVATATGDNVEFKIAAKASTSQSAGTYNNVINFIAVATPEPTPQPINCDAGKICYAPNALDVDDTMGDQSASASTSTMLWPSNFKREGYGFAGWNTELDGSGTSYGPMENITTPSTLGTEGLALYAVWVQSADYMQNWNGCSSMSIGDVTALTDLRDDNTYAVAKLADGKCWMIENLRLADKTSNNTAIVLSSTNTHNPSLPLTNNYSQSTTSDSLSASQDPTQTAWCGTNSADCDNQSMLFTGNTTNPTANMTALNTSTAVYSYGNYYNWYSVTAGNGTYSTSTSNSSVSGDICPAGWHLPKGGDDNNASNSDFRTLAVAVIGSQPNDTWTTNRSRYYNVDGGTQGTDASKAIRAFPNNFLYSGRVYGSSVNDRGSAGYYWSSTVYGSNLAYTLGFDSSYVYPGTNNSSKYSGYAARCVAGV